MVWAAAMQLRAQNHDVNRLLQTATGRVGENGGREMCHCEKKMLVVHDQCHFGVNGSQSKQWCTQGFRNARRAVPDRRMGP